MPTIASFNVNSINARLPNLLDWLRASQPDIVCLQELKCQEDAFPRAAVLELGYEAAVHGQKSWNGVAILSRLPLEDVVRGLPGEGEDAQSRWIEATVAGLRLVGLYLPNGNPVETEKYPYKLEWMARARRRAADLLEQDDRPLVLAGDYNVIPAPADCHDPANWEGDALYRPQTRQAFRAMLHLGLYDAFRAAHPDAERAWTFWDYQAGALRRDLGIRIDHFLLSAPALDRLQDCWIDKDPRQLPRASDHTPILVELA